MRASWFFVFAFFGPAGCGEVMYRYDQTTATTALAAMACKDSLSAGNDLKVIFCGEKLKAGDAAQAQSCLTEWKSTYAKIDTGCKALRIGAKEAAESREVVAAAVSKNKDALGWIARLVRLGVETAKLFAEAGLKFGGK